MTQDFITITLPALNGTEKQINWANSIRDKYTSVFLKKLSLINPLHMQERNEFSKNFNNYVQHPVMLNSYEWIENHCSCCGCRLIQNGPTSYCSNVDYCSYTKSNTNYIPT